MTEKKSQLESKKSEQVCRVCGTPLASSKESVGAFCSNRCRLQDLSKWFSENYRIASSPSSQHGDEEDE